MIKDLTEEQLAAYEESIPEWKKGALVVTEKGEPVKHRGILGRMKDKVADKITSSEKYQEF